MEEANKIIANESDRSVLLKDGQYIVSDDGKSITLASTGKGIVRLNPPKDSHTNTNELFHSIVHFSKNTPSDTFDDFDPNNQGPWHARYGGIFQYQEAFPVTQENINQALQATPTVMQIPTMGPYTPEQQNYLDNEKVKD